MSAKQIKVQSRCDNVGYSTEKLSRKCVRESRPGDLRYQEKRRKFTATTRLWMHSTGTLKPFWLCTSLLIICLATNLKRRKELCIILIGFSGSWLSGGSLKRRTWKNLTCILLYFFDSTALIR